ncbi:serine/threonine-protein kinase [Amycolatopsis sp. NPDC003731]
MASVILGGQHWELSDEPIGSGGAGRVHLATCDGYKPHVIKLVPKLPGASREWLIAGDLHGVPNVIPVLDLEETDTHWALLMAKARQSLRDYAESVGRVLPERDALVILLDIARALVELARARTIDGKVGIVHRDLKPENVLYLNGAWCVSDFGIARYSTDTTATDTARYRMTQEYAAPEQWRGETADAFTDVYAFGIIAFELLTGSRPFARPDLRRQHLHAHPPALATVSPRLAAIVTQCLCKDPGSRLTPDDLRNDLERVWSAMTGGVTPVLARGASALQRANLTESTRRSEEAYQKVEANIRAERANALFDDAHTQWATICRELKVAMLDHAPHCVVDNIGDKEGWQLGLGPAKLVFGVIKRFERKRPSGPSGYVHPNLTNLPFEVIATCFVAVGDSSLKSGGHVGRAHSLWFCDAQQPGRFAWFETAFRYAEVPRNQDDAIHQYGWLPRGRYLPCAGEPTDTLVVRALKWIADDSLMRVAWPFTPLRPGNLDEFIDRWASWFAGAAEGTLPHSSGTQGPQPAGTWRGVSRVVRDQVPSGPRTAPSRPDHDRSQRPHGSLLNVKRRRRPLRRLLHDPRTRASVWLLVGLLSLIFAAKFTDAATPWAGNLYDRDTTGMWQWLASIGLWLLTGLAVVRLSMLAMRWLKRLH